MSNADFDKIAGVVNRALRIVKPVRWSLSITVKKETYAWMKNLTDLPGKHVSLHHDKNGNSILLSDDRKVEDRE